MSNFIEFKIDDNGDLHGTVRSEAERDMGANIGDPKEHIQTIADMAGLEVNIVDPEQPQ